MLVISKLSHRIELSRVRQPSTTPPKLVTTDHAPGEVGYLGHLGHFSIPTGTRLHQRCPVQAQAATQGTPVPKESMLVVGSTGTLGRQLVRKALDNGYEVRCTVRPRQTPADFLRDWGATTVQVY